MSKTIILGEVYITTFGTEFTPIEFVRGELKDNCHINIHSDQNQREESRYLDKDGNRIRKSKLKMLKTLHIQKEFVSGARRIIKNMNPNQ